MKNNELKVTRKGVSSSEYKLSYKGVTMYAAKYHGDIETVWGLQDFDGSDMNDVFYTFRELKENFILFVNYKQSNNQL